MNLEALNWLVNNQLNSSLQQKIDTKDTSMAKMALPIYY
jgi:hypothetical protein